MLGISFAAGLILSVPPATASPTEPGDLEQALTTAQACSTCHDFFTPESLAIDGGSVDPWAWSGSMMANAARDPVFWAGVALADQDHPGETEDCVRCHAQQAFLSGQGGVTELGELDAEGREGVECDLCHRMVDDGEGLIGNARFTLADAPEGESIPRFGPWTYEELGPQPPHPWSGETSFLADSAMCGTCHDVSTGRERVDDQGVGMGAPFNEQRTYSEWLGSAYASDGPDAATCQSCHMPTIEGPILGCNLFAGAPHQDGGRRHVLVGANATTLRVMKELYGDAGTGEVPDARFEESILWTEEFAATAASLDIEFPDSVDASVGIQDLSVTVTNETGHKLPSGYSEGRVMWLEITARYDGQLLWSSGRWDSQQGSFESDPQLRRYEAIAERWADGRQLHLLLNDHWLLDSRIPPKGLSPNPETDPVGGRYLLGDDDTWPHSDRHSYSFPGQSLMDSSPGMDGDELEISVRLLYLINTPEYLQVLRDDNNSNLAGEVAQDAFSAIGGPEPIVLAQRSQIVALTGLEGGESTEDSSEDSGRDTGGDSSEGSVATGTGSETGPLDDGGGASCGCRTRPRGPGRLGPLTLILLLAVPASRRLCSPAPS